MIVHIGHGSLEGEEKYYSCAVDDGDDDDVGVAPIPSPLARSIEQ